MIVLFRRERGGGGRCYFGITIPFIAPLLTLFPVGWRSVMGQRNVADVFCLFVCDQTSAWTEMGLLQLGLPYLKIMIVSKDEVLSTS